MVISCYIPYKKRDITFYPLVVRAILMLPTRGLESVTLCVGS